MWMRGSKAAMISQFSKKGSSAEGKARKSDSEMVIS